MAEGADDFIETERKYDAAAAFALPDLAGLDGVAAVTGPQTYRLRAVYFDTPDFSLAKAKITLRRRTGGTDAGWHLKLPAGAEDRREVHAPLGRSTRKVPARLAEMVTRWTGGRRSSPSRGWRPPAGSGAWPARTARCSRRSPTTWWSGSLPDRSDSPTSAAKRVGPGWARHARVAGGAPLARSGDRTGHGPARAARLGSARVLVPRGCGAVRRRLQAQPAAHLGARVPSQRRSE